MHNDREGRRIVYQKVEIIYKTKMMNKQKKIIKITQFNWIS